MTVQLSKWDTTIPRWQTPKTIRRCSQKCKRRLRTLHASAWMWLVKVWTGFGTVRLGEILNMFSFCRLKLMQKKRRTVQRLRTETSLLGLCCFFLWSFHTWRGSASWGNSFLFQVQWFSEDWKILEKKLFLRSLSRWCTKHWSELKE